MTQPIHHHFDHAVAQALIPPRVAAEFSAWFARLPGLKRIVDGLVAAVGAANINWPALAQLVAKLIASGASPMTILMTILSDLSQVLNQPEAHSLAAAEGLVMAVHQPAQGETTA